jgi:hypothetical protein
MKIAVFAATAVVMLGGCALIPVQDQTLKNDAGASIICHQVGRGVVSYWVGKSSFESCVEKARAEGYK